MGDHANELKQKTRLDVAVVEKGLAPSRERARALILAGQVRVNGQVVFANGRTTGTFPGRVLRRSEQAAANGQ